MAHTYACQCLNVKIRGTSSPSGSPNSSDPSVQRVNVGDAGIQIAHPQLTLRGGTVVEGGQNRVKYITLTCLLCDTFTYRVPADGAGVETGEGRMPPQDSESQTLKSRDGWVEVSSSCVTGPAYTQATSSSLYSPVFSILLPPKPPHSPPPQSAADSLPYSIPPLTSCLPPLFLAAPFTPAHPVYHNFSRHAIKTSDELRKAVQQDLEAFVSSKIEELASIERGLKRDVDYLWRKWKEAWKHLNESTDAPDIRRRESGHPVPTIKDFVPHPLATPEKPSDSPRPPPRGANSSLLSASLAATSSLHQHMNPSATTSDDRSPSLSPHSSPISTALSSPPTGSVSIAAFSRRVDESVAIAASYKLQMEDEEAMAATVAEHRKRVLQESKADAEVSEQLPARGRTPPSGNRRVQFAEDGKKDDDDEETNPPEDAAEPELFDFEPIPSQAQGRSGSVDASLTPLSSPRRAARRLEETGAAPSEGPQEPPKPPPVQSDSSPVKLGPSEMKLRAIMAAEAPSHRAAWKNLETAQEMLSSENAPEREEEDSESISDISEKSDKRATADMARSLPITIGHMSAFGLPKPESRAPKMSLADRPSVVAPSTRRQRASFSMATRERAYLARDITRPMDPGHALSLGDDIAEDEEEERVGTEHAGAQGGSESPTDQGKRRALQILQKIQNDVPEAGMWRSVAD